MRPLVIALIATACAGSPKIETKVGPGLRSAEPAATATLAEDPRTLSFERLQFEPRQATVHKLPDSQLVAWFAPDTELPLVNLALFIGMGNRDNPADKPGVVELLERTLAVGGAGGRSPSQFADAAESRAMEVHVSVGDDRTTVRVAALAKDLALAFELMSDVVRRPLYDAERLEIERGRAIEAVRRRNDHPQGIASRELRKALYGAGSRWVQQPTQAELKAVTRDDIVALHKRYFVASNARLVAVGDIAADAFSAGLTAGFGGWQGDKPERPADKRTERLPGPTRRLAVKQSGQAVILAGQRWLPRHHPDRHTSDLLNYILGGGVFQSRLGEAIRSDRGLAYSVSTGVRRLQDDDGYLYVFVGTEPKNLDQVLGLIHQVTDAMRAKADVSAEELSQAKDAFLNSHVFNFDTAYGVAAQQAVLDHYGYAPDWLTRYPERIAAVSADDIARVARERLTPDKFATIVVGPAAPSGDGWQPIDLEAAIR